MTPLAIGVHTSLALSKQFIDIPSYNPSRKTTPTPFQRTAENLRLRKSQFLLEFFSGRGFRMRIEVVPNEGTGGAGILLRTIGKDKKRSSEP